MALDTAIVIHYHKKFRTNFTTNFTCLVQSTAMKIPRQLFFLHSLIQKQTRLLVFWGKKVWSMNVAIDLFIITVSTDIANPVTNFLLLV